MLSQSHHKTLTNQVPGAKHAPSCGGRLRAFSTSSPPPLPKRRPTCTLLSRSKILTVKKAKKVKADQSLKFSTSSSPKKTLDQLFPSSAALPSIRCKNRKIEENAEQLLAVQHIVAGLKISNSRNQLLLQVAVGQHLISSLVRLARERQSLWLKQSSRFMNLSQTPKSWLLLLATLRRTSWPSV